MKPLLRLALLTATVISLSSLLAAGPEDQSLIDRVVSPFGEAAEDGGIPPHAEPDISARPTSIQ